MLLNKTKIGNFYTNKAPNVVDRFPLVKSLMSC